MSKTLHAEYVAAAKSAGLRYVTDAQPGITRRRVGTGWAYRAASGTRVSDREERKRLASLAIPPAWTDVWICPDARGHLQVTARVGTDPDIGPGRGDRQRRQAPPLLTIGDSIA
ncbi:MAG: hypothetical protein ACKVS7_13840 [Gemmatimonadaceae bacterium]